VDAPPNAWLEVARSADSRAVRHWALVLQSLGVPHAVSQQPGTHLLLVPVDRAAQASAELRRYEQENRGWPPREVLPKPNSDGIVLAVGYLALIGILHLAVLRDLFQLDWKDAGSARALEITAGEWWQAITALTLHADIVHLAGNMLFGAVFGLFLAHSVGSGLAALGFVITGAAGNLVNAWVQPSEHVSIGASTAVFGVLGAQVAYEFVRRKDGRMPSWKKRLPLVIGLILLGMLGMGGVSHDITNIEAESRRFEQLLERTDVVAHITGFLSGLLYGALLGWRRRLPPFRDMTDSLLGACALLAILGAWILAFRAH
jgi:membrane associated rhomboid family serine protease